MARAFWREALQKYKGLKILLCAGAAALFLLVVYGIAYHNADLWHLWLPISITDDEVMYNRQLVGVLANGQPAGYFGYNETHAAIGHFSVWGPVLIYLYALPGLLVGAGCNTMVWCNLVFAILGWTIFAWGARLSWKKQLAFAAALVCVWFPLRQVYTGMSEPLQYACILVILGASAALERKFSVGWYLVLAAACAITTLTHAYTVLFWVFPILLLWKPHRRLAVTSGVLAVASLGGYLLVSLQFCSPYFSGGGVDYTGLGLLAQGKPVQAVVYEIQHVVQQARTLWELYVQPTLTGNYQDQGRAILTTGVLTLVTLICLIRDIRKKRSVKCKVGALVCVVGSMAMLFGLYDVGTLHRHCAMLNVLLLGVLVYENIRQAALYLLPLLILLPMNYAPGTLPTYREDIDAQIQTARAALTESWQARASEDPWDSTLAYAYADGVFHGFLYAVPDGMGIQFDMNTYIADETQPIYSRYAMVNHGTDAEARLLAEGWQQLVSTEKLVVYERPDAVQ